MSDRPCQHRDPESLNADPACGVVRDKATGETCRVFFLRYQGVPPEGFTYRQVVGLCPLHFALWSKQGPQPWALEPVAVKREALDLLGDAPYQAVPVAAEVPIPVATTKAKSKPRKPVADPVPVAPSEPSLFA